MAHYTAEQPHTQGHASMFHIFTKDVLWQTHVHRGVGPSLICRHTSSSREEATFDHLSHSLAHYLDIV
jgi:hypothetical protein